MARKARLRLKSFSLLTSWFPSEISPAARGRPLKHMSVSRATFITPYGPRETHWVHCPANPTPPQVPLKGQKEDSASNTFRGTAVPTLGCTPPLLLHSPSGFVHCLVITECWFYNLEEGRRHRRAKHTAPCPSVSSLSQSLPFTISAPCAPTCLSLLLPRLISSIPLVNMRPRP